MIVNHELLSKIFISTILCLIHDEDDMEMSFKIPSQHKRKLSYICAFLISSNSNDNIVENIVRAITDDYYLSAKTIKRRAAKRKRSTSQ